MVMCYNDVSKAACTICTYWKFVGNNSAHLLWSYYVILAHRRLLSYVALYRLLFVDSIVNLGHTIRFDLCDSDDIDRTCDMIRKATCLLQTFSAADAMTKSRLLQAYCLSLRSSALTAGIFIVGKC